MIGAFYMLVKLPERTVTHKGYQNCYIKLKFNKLICTVKSHGQIPALQFQLTFEGYVVGAREISRKLSPSGISCKLNFSFSNSTIALKDRNVSRSMQFN